MEFEHVTLGQRVLFGSGHSAGYLSGEVARRDARRVMAVASRRERPLAERVCAGIDVALWFDEVVPHVPVATAEAARRAAAEAEADLLVCVGGGSTVGLAKAVALTTGIPIVAVPTTYAGSEATNVWGLTEERTKRTGVDDRVLPETVVYDAELTRSLPAPLSVSSGLNALAHCVDSLWAPRADPINRALALEGARALARALPAVAQDPEGLPGREQALYGCYLAAVAFASAGSGLHHKICHVLGGTFDLPHAQTHAVVLPHVLALNGPAVPELAERLAAALGAERNAEVSGTRGAAEIAVRAINDLYERLGAPLRLADHGLTGDDIPEAAGRVLDAVPACTPAPVDEQGITALLTGALEGVPASVHPKTR